MAGKAKIKVKNEGKSPLKINHVTIDSGKEYTLTDNDQENEMLMKKVNHMIGIGVLAAS